MWIFSNVLGKLRHFQFSYFLPMLSSYWIASRAIYPPALTTKAQRFISKISTWCEFDKVTSQELLKFIFLEFLLISKCVRVQVVGKIINESLIYFERANLDAHYQFIVQFNNGMSTLFKCTIYTPCIVNLFTSFSMWFCLHYSICNTKLIINSKLKNNLNIINNKYTYPSSESIFRIQLGILYLSIHCLYDLAYPFTQFLLLAALFFIAAIEITIICLQVLGQFYGFLSLKQNKILVNILLWTAAFGGILFIIWLTIACNVLTLIGNFLSSVIACILVSVVVHFYKGFINRYLLVYNSNDFLRILEFLCINMWCQWDHPSSLVHTQSASASSVMVLKFPHFLICVNFMIIVDHRKRNHFLKTFLRSVMAILFMQMRDWGCINEKIIRIYDHCGWGCGCGSSMNLA